VVPSRWEQHITPDIENKWKAKPYSYLPDYVKYPGVVTEALIKNQHLPKKVSESDQARKYREMKANKPSAITVNDGIKLIMPPKKNTKKTKKKKKSFKKRVKVATPVIFSTVPTGQRLSKAKPIISKVYGSKRDSAKFSFGQGSKPGCLIMNGVQRVGVIVRTTLLNGYATASTNIIGAGIDYDAVGTYLSDTIVPLNPNMVNYWGYPLQRFASIFSKFRFLKLKFHFKTRVPTSSVGGLTLAYTEDPNWGESRGAGSAGPITNIAWKNSDLVMLPHELSFPLWNNVTFEVPISKPRSDMFYYSNSEYGVDLETSHPFYFGASELTAQDRQNLQGIVYLNGFVTALAAGTQVGDLFAEYSLEFCDMMPPAIAAIPSATLLFDRKLVAALERLKVKEQDKEEKQLTL